MKIQKISVKKFRHMEDITIEFGKYLTVISGLNGTGKSSILGLVGQLFDYKGHEKTKDGKRFAAKYSEIFKFCPTYDQKQTYRYDAEITDNEKVITKEVKSRYIKTENRFRLDVGIRAKAGEGGHNSGDTYLIMHSKNDILGFCFRG